MLLVRHRTPLTRDCPHLSDVCRTFRLRCCSFCDTTWTASTRALLRAQVGHTEAPHELLCPM